MRNGQGATMRRCACEKTRHQAGFFTSAGCVTQGLQQAHHVLLIRLVQLIEQAQQGLFLLAWLGVVVVTVVLLEIVLRHVYSVHVCRAPGAS